MAETLYLDAFKVQKFLMTLTGIWPTEDMGRWYKLYGFLVSFVLQATIMMPSLAQVFSQSADVAHGSYILFSTMTIFAYGIKFAIFYAKRHSFYEILDDLKQPLFKPHTRFEIFMKNAVLVSNRMRKLIQFPCILFIIFIAAFPALDYGSKRSLPYDLPININELPFLLYVMVYFLQIFAAAVCACNNVNMDTLACSLMALGTAQLRILRGSLKLSACVASSAQEKSRNFEADLARYRKFDETVKKNLKRCAELHIAITSYVGKLEGLFTYIFFVQFLTSVVVICVGGFSFIVTPVSNVLFGASLSYFAAAMVEISMYCIFGDELMLESMKITDACYMSEWKECGPEIRKNLLIIMEKSKKPLFLTAGKFTRLSRESLVTLCKSSFSYFAVLRKIYGNEKQ